MNPRNYVVLLLCTASAACYTRVPMTATVPAPATRIVATLTDSGVVAMSNAIGPGAVEIEGVVAAADNEQFNLQLLRVDHRDGRSISWNREPVAFRRSTLTDVNVIRLNKTKSWVAAGGIVIGAYVLARTFNLIGAAEEDENTTDPTQSWVPNGRR